MVNAEQGQNMRHWQNSQARRAEHIIYVRMLHECGTSPPARLKTDVNIPTRLRTHWHTE